MIITVVSAEKSQGTSKTGKPYTFIDLAYKGEDGKITGKKIMSFGDSKPVYESLSNSGNGDIFEIRAVKNEASGYWDWVGASKATIATLVGGSPDTSTPQRAPAGKVLGSNYETPEERAKKQVYIVRQSSINAAIATLDPARQTEFSIEDVIAVAKQYEAYVFDIGTPVAATKIDLTDDVL